MTEAATDTVIKQMEEVAILPYEEVGNEDAVAHVINPPLNLHIWKPNMSSQDVVDIARARQQEVTALCGYKFIPKFNPDKLPVCMPCMDKAGELIRGLR